MSSDPVQIQPAIVINPPPLPQNIDPKGVVEAVNGVIPETGKGFLPLTDFNLHKPYDELAANLKEQQERLNNSPIDPATTIEELKAGKKELEIKRDDVLDKRISDHEKFFDARLKDLNTYHTEVLQLKDDTINKLQGHVDELKVENKNLESQRDDERNRRLAELQHFNDQRIADLERYHANELALTERFTQLMERKQQIEEQRIRDDKIAIEEDRRNWYKTILTSIRDSSLAKLFK